MAQAVPPVAGGGQAAGYGKSAAAVLAGAGTTLAVLSLDAVLGWYGHGPVSAEWSDAFQTFVTTAAVFWTPHNAFGGG